MCQLGKDMDFTVTFLYAHIRYFAILTSHSHSPSESQQKIHPTIYSLQNSLKFFNIYIYFSRHASIYTFLVPTPNFQCQWESHFVQQKTFATYLSWVEDFCSGSESHTSIITNPLPDLLLKAFLGLSLKRWNFKLQIFKFIHSNFLLTAHKLLYLSWVHFCTISTLKTAANGNRKQLLRFHSINCSLRAEFADLCHLETKSKQQFDLGVHLRENERFVFNKTKRKNMPQRLKWLIKHKIVIIWLSCRRLPSPILEAQVPASWDILDCLAKYSSLHNMGNHGPNF